MYQTTNSDEGQRLKAIFTMATDGIITIDQRGIIEYMNPAAFSLFGYSAEEAIGQNVSMLMPSPYQERHDTYMENYHRTRVPKIIGIGREVQGRCKDGTVFPLRLAVSEVVLDDRVIYTGMIHDITVEKESFAEIERLNGQLEERVHQRTEELASVVNKLLDTNHRLEQEIDERQGIQQELQQKQSELTSLLETEKKLNELKSRFVSIASHEFRTPLSTVLSSAALAMRYTLPEQQDKREKHLNRIKQAVAHLTNILNDFLSLSRLQEGKIEAQLSDFDLFELAADIIEEMSTQMKNGQKLVFHKSSDELMVHSDPRILKNILLNLISNAVKYSEPGKTVQLSIAPKNKNFVVEIKDEGIGIPEEDQKHLFSRFFRASNVTNIQGTGLGLNIVMRYAEMLGGKIDYTSVHGEGSTFWVTLPLHFEQ